MLAGSQYLISICQLYKAESKLRLQNYLPYAKMNISYIDNENEIYNDFENIFD